MNTNQGPERDEKYVYHFVSIYIGSDDTEQKRWFAGYPAASTVWILSVCVYLQIPAAVAVTE